LSKAVVGFVDFLMAFAILFVLMAIYRVTPSPNMVFLPGCILLTVVSALAAGIWLSVLTIRYRDFQHIIPFLVQFWLYATPIAYPSETIIDNLPRWGTVLYYLIPMAGVVEGFRWSVLGGAPPNSLAYLSFGVVI